ncbi:MAG: response regulator [Gammaproteobacteria bacterium]|nr:response regulator [Gammaproteobacteria bacterium]
MNDGEIRNAEGSLSTGVDLKTILIVEDDDHLRSYLGELLELSGFRVILAEDGNQGLFKFDKYRPDLVLTDVVLPGRDGISLTIRFKKIRPEVRVIAMSGRWLNDDEIDCSESVGFLGVDKILAKPFSARELKQVILDVMEIELC